jgi:hypothetical protein
MNWVFYIPEDGILHSHHCENLQMLYSINRLGTVSETLCVSCDVRSGCFISQKTTFFVVTAVKTSNVTYVGLHDIPIPICRRTVCCVAYYIGEITFQWSHYLASCYTVTPPAFRYTPTPWSHKTSFPCSSYCSSPHKRHIRVVPTQGQECFELSDECWVHGKKSIREIRDQRVGPC